MANTTSILSYANTFGDWMVQTNALSKENNDLAANNYIKSSGTLYLNSPTLGLQVANNAVIAGQLQVSGTGSSAFIQNNLTVSTGQVYFSNTILGLTNAGQANIGGPLLALSSGTGLTVSNDAIVGGNTSIYGNAIITGNTSIANNLVVTKNTSSNNLNVTYNSNTNTLTVFNNAYVNNDLNVVNRTLTYTLQANTNVNTATLSVSGTSYTNISQANTSVNTATLSVSGTSYTNISQANTSVNTATLSVTGISYTNTLQANTNINTVTSSVSGTSYTDTLQSNTSVNTAILSVTGTSYTNTLQANTNINTVTSSVSGTSYTDTLQANTNINTVTSSVSGTSFVNILQGNTSVNTATLSVTGTGYANILQGNTSVNTATLGVTGTSRLNILQANTVVNTAILSVTGTSYTNISQANTSVNTATLSVTGTSYTNILQANTSVNTAILSVTGTSYTNSLQTNGASNLLGDVVIGTPSGASANLTVTGNFVILGKSLLDTDRIVLKATTAQTIGAGYDYIEINRGEATNSANANSQIRWNEPTRNWDIRDVSSPTNYYRILTNQHLSDSITTSSSIVVATSQAAKSLNDAITTANTSLKSYTDNTITTANTSMKSYVDVNATSLQSQITSNVNTLNASVTSAYQRANTSSNTFTGTTGSASPASGVITFASGNGVTTVGSGSTITINTAQDLRTTAGPTFASLLLTAPLAINQGGTGTSSAGSALTALLPTGTTAGYVLTTGGPGSFSWSAPVGGSGGGTAPGTTIASTRLTTPSAGSNQTTFVSPVFVAGANQVRLYIDGVRQFDGYTETITTASFTGAISITGVLTVSGTVTGTITNGMTLSGSGINNGVTITSLGTGSGGIGSYNTNQLLVATSTSITGSAYSVVLATGVNVGDAVLVEVDGYVINPYYANNITFTAPQGGIVGTANTIQLAITDLETRKATSASPQLTGLPLSVTSGVSVSGNTQIATTAFVYNALANTSSTYACSISGTAGLTTAAVTFTNTGGAAAGTTFNGSSAKTIDYSTLGASPLAGSSSLTTTGTVGTGTWSGLFGAVTGANLTNLTAGNLTGTIPSTVLGNSSVLIGTTSVALNRTTADLALAGITSVTGTTTLTLNSTTTSSLTIDSTTTGSINIGTNANIKAITIGNATVTSTIALNNNVTLPLGKTLTLSGATSGTVSLLAAGVAGTTSITFPATSGTVITGGDSGTVTNTMLAGSIANGKLVNTSITIGSTAISLGGSSTTLAGLTSVASTGFTGALTGNADTATKLTTARMINGVNFDGSAAITITAVASDVSAWAKAATKPSYSTTEITGFAIGGVGEIGRYLDFHGASTGAADFDVRLDGGAGNGTTGSGILTVTANGGAVFSNNVTAYSDIRLKENIQVISNAVDKVKALRGVTFTRNDLSDTTKLHTGVIAQEVLSVLPEAVTQGDNGIYSVAYGNMVGLLIEAIKELKVEIDILKGNK